ncbi:MAG TPA: hypothetical protein VK453_24400 [Micromonosporaceae bacterium]|nr:hypothetical protein [Micromonosporaceae bacterium]
MSAPIEDLQAADDDRMRGEPLTMTLQVAVPLWVQQAGPPGDARDQLLSRWAADAEPILCQHGDVILYRSKPREFRSADAFNHLARGLAALAHHCGGVRVFGLHWCATHSPGGTMPTTAAACAQCLAADLRRRNLPEEPP